MYRSLSKEAFLGTAAIRIGGSEALASPELEFGVYNKGRETQESFVRYVAGEMAKGRCENMLYPLIAAVPSGAIKSACLTKDYDGAAPLREVEYEQALPTERVVILAGRQRVEASQRASRTLKERLKALQDRISTLQAPESNKKEKSHTVDQTSVSVANAEIAQVKNLIGRVETWPVNFYDIGKRVHACLLWVGKLMCNSLLKDELRDLVKRLPKGIAKGGKDVLLQFLSENTQDLKVAKTPNERFIEIMNRNLYSPQEASHWKYLFEGCRQVESFCHRKHIWNLATTAFQVSSSLHKSWVLTSSGLAKVSSSHSALVCGFQMYLTCANMWGQN